MRRFKLIKEYPGSGAVGTISQPNDLLQHDFFEKYSEYWQEVTEPTFQIISFTSTVVWDGKLATLLPDGTYCTNPKSNSGWTLREMLEVGSCVKSGDLQIHSVKRLSDGEIFTIGDRAKTITSKNSHTIRQFRIKQYCTGTDAKGKYIYDGIDRIWIDWEKDCGGNWLESTEKIVEKDFEITEIQLKDKTILTFNGQKCIKRSDQLSPGITHGLDKCLSDPVVTVHSVKRISDGEIFTVGDKFKAKIGGSEVVRTVESIRVDGNILTIYQEHGWLTNEIERGGIFHEITKYVERKPLIITEDGVPVYSYGSVQHWVVNGNYEYALGLCRSNVDLLKNEPHIYRVFSTEAAAREYVRKQTPIFVTEDEVKIFEGDIYWFVDTDLSISMIKALYGCGQYIERKYFSTFKLAEEYVIKNAKVLSIEDFWQFTSSAGSNVVKNTQLKQLVKQRLHK